MSENLISTSPGGRSGQYESIKTVTNPPEKLAGQLGHANPAPGSKRSHDELTRSDTNMDEGIEQKTPDSKPAYSSGDLDANTRKARVEQGYEGEREMDLNVGA
ncbi:hypothetical protein EJ06DRAFT_556617 [Trichodelitschia bisporula]|uniref:Uncharacterized protein n=1 Tax=Trichodelitschia bisporula TaxID=703511 RepID=A0A6G1HWH1_9PEZI|nr:hypothetical protein EJ06DRAFT_556617 [Trichodelitschia bisporula]